MSKAAHLAAYAEGWATGNSDKIRSALADNYVLDDPNRGRVKKVEMAALLDGVKATVSELRGGREEAQSLALSDVLSAKADGKLTAWCWWTVPGTSIKGGGMSKASDDGVSRSDSPVYTALSP